MNKWKLGSKMYFGFGLILVILLAVAVITYINVTNINKAEVKLSIATDTAIEALELSRLANSYYLSKDENTTALVESSYIHLISSIDEEISNFKQQHDIDDLNSAKDELSSFLANFKDYTSIHQSNNSLKTKMETESQNIKDRFETMIADFTIKYSHMASNMKNSPSTQTRADFSKLDTAFEEVELSNHADEIFLAMSKSQLAYITSNNEIYDNEVLELKQSLTDELDKLSNILTTSKENKIHAEIVSMLAALSETYESFKELIIQEEAALVAAETNIEEAIIHLEEIEADEMAALENLISSSIQLLIILCSAGLLAGILAAIIISRTTTKQMSNSMNTMMKSSNQVASAAQQIAATSQQLSSGTQEQASSVEEMSGIIQTITETIRETTGNTSEASALTMNAQKLAEQATSEMSIMQDVITEIEKSSTEISKIMNIIENITFQTNILSLNASVEAAKAGEAGASFMVVADEVKNLAKKSQESLNDSSSIVENNIKIAKDGVAASLRVADALASINKQVNDVNTLISDVSMASKSQEQGMEQLNTAVVQVERVTQENAAGAEETAAAGEELNAQSDQMVESINIVNKLVSGKTEMNIEKREPARTVAFNQPYTPISRKRNPAYSNTGSASDVLPLEDSPDDF